MPKTIGKQAAPARSAGKSAKKAAVKLSSPDKILFPEDGITKGELVDYYRDVAEVMLPHIIDRPISMQRFPEGIHGVRFYQKETPDYFPDWIEEVKVEKEATSRDPDTEQCQVMCNRPETLMYLANLACITPHTWLSRKSDLYKPDRLIFDFDPAGEGFDFNWVKAGACTMRDLLEEQGLPSFVMTTGSRGLHVTVPIKPEFDFNEIKPFARKLSELLVAQDPERFTIEHRKKERGDRVFVDYLRNEYAQTAVPPYAVRPKPGAPVAMPLSWDELADSKLHSQKYTLRNVFKRLDRIGDPWGGIDRMAVSLREIL